VFDKHEGFEPSRLYPGFSADFFDTFHNVVVCGILYYTLFDHVYSWSPFKDWWVLRHDSTSSGTPRTAELFPAQLSLRVERRSSCVRRGEVKPDLREGFLEEVERKCQSVFVRTTSC